MSNVSFLKNLKKDNSFSNFTSMRQSRLKLKIRKEPPKDELSINAQLLERGNFVSKLMAGVYSYLPLGQRVLAKIENIIRSEMNKLEACEILMPALQPKENWEVTGRWNEIDVLFKLKGAGDKDLALGPTHEEIITPLCAQIINSYKDLPLSFYQIQTKFRNEVRAKSGLLRGREFRMKDLYSFHATTDDFDAYYAKVMESYHTIFKLCGIGDVTYLTLASGGSFTKYSHEFQTITPSGEDIIYLCKNCNIGINKEIVAEHNFICPECSNSNLVQEKSIEVGNIFKLMTRFSSAFKMRFQDVEGKDKEIYMGCYGIGSSRLLGTIVETLHDQHGIIWPQTIAPFQVHLVSLCQNDADINKADAIYSKLTQFGIEVLYDDRLNVSPGAKFSESDLIGIPFRMIVSPKNLSSNMIEMKFRKTGETDYILIDELQNFLEKEYAAS